MIYRFIQLEDTNAVLQAKVIDKSEASSSYEKKIHELENEMQMLQQRIRESELKADMPSAAVIQLQQQTAQLKVTIALFRSLSSFEN